MPFRAYTFRLVLIPRQGRVVWERRPSNISLPAIYHQMIIYSLTTLNPIVFEISPRFFMEQNGAALFYKSSFFASPNIS